MIEGQELAEVDVVGRDVAVRSRQPIVVAVVGAQERAEAVVRAVAGELGVAATNVGVDLGALIQDVSPRHRPVRIERALRELVPEEAAVLTRIELLFAPDLAVQPLQLLRKLRRSRPVVVHWPGEYVDGDLVYAHPGHPEYVREHAEGFEVVDVGGSI